MLNLKFLILISIICLPALSEARDFERKNIDGYSILVPTGFRLLTEAEAKVKYPSDRRPKLIYSNDEVTVNLSFKTGDGAIGNLAGFLDFFVKNILSASNSKILSQGVKKLDGKDIGYLVFISPAPDTNIYNYMLIADINQVKNIMVSFNFTEALKDEWSNDAEKIINSLEFTKAK